MLLNWKSPYNDGGSPVLNYRIYWGTSATFLLFLVASQGTNATDTGLTNGQTYYYQVSAVNEVGEGPRCAVFSGVLASSPGPLTDLQAVSSDSKVTLTWTAPSNNGGSPITGYTVYRSTQSGSEKVLISVTGTTYMDLNLVNGVTYYYWVSAFNAASEGQISNEVASTPSAVLGPPTLITATPSDSTITLRWAAPDNTGGSGVSSYRIYRGTSITSLLFLELVQSSQTIYPDAGLTNGQTYFYKISSVNTVGEGAQSAAISAVPFSIPSAPQSLSATGGNGGVSLGWSAPFSNGGASILCYHVYRSTTSDGTYIRIGSPTGTFYTDTGLTNGLTYYYKVAAVNADGEGPMTAIKSATPRTVPSTPAVISAIGGLGTVNITWTAPLIDGGAALTKYSVYRGTSSGSETLLGDAGLALYLNDSSAGAGITYYYRVTAWNSQGEGLRSNEVSATTYGVPTAPQSLVGSAGDTSVALQWSAPSSDGGSSVTVYRVFFGTQSGTYSGNRTVSSNTFIQQSLVNGVRYYYAVSALNAVGEGPLSAEYSAVPMTNPTAPQSLLALPGVKQIALSWSPPLVNGGADITGYKLYRGPTATDQTLVATLDSDLEFTDTGLADGTTYHYSISALNSKGESLHSLDASARTNTVPTVPQGFSATVGDSLASLVWTPPTDNGGAAISSYNVYRSVTQGNYVLVGNTASRSYSDPGLTNGQRYYYSVAALNAVGEGPRTTQMVIVPATSPAITTNLAAIPGVRSISMTWSMPTSDGGSPLLGYHILRGNAPGAETQYADVSTNAFTDSHLSDGETHYYKVVAYNAVSSGPESNEDHATTFTLPSAPTFLQVVCSDGSVSLYWSGPVTNGGTSVLYYTVYWGSSPDSLSLLTSIASLSYDVRGLTNGHVYYCSVSATNAVGESSDTDQLTATPSRMPSAPTDFASLGGIRQIALNWYAPADNGGAGVTSYRLYRASAANGSFELAISLPATSYTDTQLDNGVQYFYRITAVNSAGEGPYAETNATTSPLPRSANLQASTSGLDVHLSWAVSEGATSYRIYRGDGSGQETYLRSVLTNTYVDGPFVAGRTLYYYVTAVNITGESQPSNEANVTIVTQPSAPSNLVAGMAGNKAVLTWDPPASDGSANITSYQILRGTSHGTEVPIGTSTGTEYNDSNVVSGTHYFYQVKAVNSAGTGPVSNEASLLFTDTFTAPVLTATAGMAKVILKWTPPILTNGNLITGYKVYRSTTSGAEKFLIGANINEMTDTGVTVGQTYYYQVTAFTATEEGPSSNEANATPCTLPGIPTSFAVTAGDASALLNWSAPAYDGFAPILGYHIFRGQQSGNLSQVASATELGYHDTGLAAGTTYYYRITAFNAAGDGNSTPEVPITTPIKVDPPLGLTATAGEGKITLAWNQPTGVSVFTYSIFRGNASGDEVFLINDPDTSWVDQNVTDGKTYYYKVSAMTFQGESQMSEEASATPLAAQKAVSQSGSLLDELWFRIVMIMTILVIGFFSFVIFVKKGAVKVKRDK